MSSWFCKIFLVFLCSAGLSRASASEQYVTIPSREQLKSLLHQAALDDFAERSKILHIVNQKVQAKWVANYVNKELDTYYADLYRTLFRQVDEKQVDAKLIKEQQEQDKKTVDFFMKVHRYALLRVLLPKDRLRLVLQLLD
jgi:hypothetical protein